MNNQLKKASVFASTIVAAGLIAGGSPAFAQAELVITPIEHATMTIDWNGTQILVDPGFRGDLCSLDLSPDVVLITHDHRDHFNEEALACVSTPSTVVIRNQDWSGGGITVEAVPMWGFLHPEGEGAGYVITAGDTKIYIAGDTHHIPDEAAGADIAFVPLLWPFTFDADNAAREINRARPDVVIPYHYLGNDPSVLADLIDPGIELWLWDWYPVTDSPFPVAIR